MPAPGTSVKMQRVVVFLPRAAVKACDLAAAKYATSRSEVVRLAIADGLKGAVAVLDSLRDVRMLEAAGTGAARVWRDRGVAQPRESLDPLDADRAVSALLDYGRAAQAANSGITVDALRSSLQLHAQVIGVVPDDLDEVLVDVLAQLFGQPQLEEVDDPSRPPE